jgi:hypothetical protein
VIIIERVLTMDPITVLLLDPTMLDTSSLLLAIFHREMEIRPNLPCLPRLVERALKTVLEKTEVIPREQKKASHWPPMR